MKERSRNTSYRIEPSVMQQLRDYCQLNGVRIGWFVTQAIREKLEKVPRSTFERQMS